MALLDVADQGCPHCGAVVEPNRTAEGLVCPVCRNLGWAPPAFSQASPQVAEIQSDAEQTRLGKRATGAVWVGVLGFFAAIGSFASEIWLFWAVVLAGAAIWSGSATRKRLRLFEHTRATKRATLAIEFGWLAVGTLVLSVIFMVVESPESAAALPEAAGGLADVEAQPSIPTDYDAAATDGGIFDRHWTWEFRGSEWTFEVQVPVESYDYYRGLPRAVRAVESAQGKLAYENAYDIYVTSPLDDAVIADLSASFRRQAVQQGWTLDETLSFVLSFVQSMPYTVDSTTTPFDEYPRYPLETLVDNGGDCEDTSILFASLVREMGYGAILILPPSHAAVGVQAEESTPGYAFTLQGIRYLYAETTGDGWSLGEIPPDYSGSAANLLSLEPRALLSLEMSLGGLAGRNQEVHLKSYNQGSATTGIHMTAGLTANGEDFYEIAECEIDSVAPGDELTCDLHLDLGMVPRGQEVVILAFVADINYRYNEVASEPWTPRP
jgi:hypothetical protein